MLKFLRNERGDLLIVPVAAIIFLFLLMAATGLDKSFDKVGMSNTVQETGDGR